MGHRDIFLVKLNSDISLNWSMVIGGVDYDYGEAVQQTSDNGYIITGYGQNFGIGSADIFLAKFDSNGDLSWSRAIGGNVPDYGLSVEQTSDSGYIVIGDTYSFGVGDSDVILVKFSNNGTMSWSKAIGGSGSDHGYSVQQTNDDGFIITGQIDNTAEGSAEDVLLAKFTENGDLIWSKAIGGTLADSGCSVHETHDGGLIITGYMKIFGPSAKGLVLAKLDSQGELETESATVQIKNASVTVTNIVPTVNDVAPNITLISPTIINITSLLAIQDIPQAALVTIYEGGLKDKNILIGEQFSYQFSDELFYDPDGDFLAYNNNINEW